jgi:hypothetical protein
MHRRATTTITLVLFALAITTQLAFADSGTIISPHQYAWDDNGGYVNWDATGGDVTVTDTALTGYIWSAGFGWINLSPTEGGVTNDAGVLGGYAWGENTGWIDFTGVSIDSNGVLHGHTVAQSTFGTMTFDCTYCDVTTSWLAPYTAPATPAPTVSVGNGPPGLIGQTSTTYLPPVVSTSSQPLNTQPPATSVPPSLIPTSSPHRIKPTTKPPTAAAHQVAPQPPKPQAATTTTTTPIAASPSYS